MEIPRRILEESYLLLKPLIFAATKNNPEIAHDFVINKAKYLHEKNLDKFLFDCSANRKYSGLELSPAAGLNKNGDFHPLFLKYLGFERVVVGTVTNDLWDGNPQPRIKRYPKKKSLTNRMGLPGEGSRVVAERLINYGDHNVPLTINLMSTPEKEGDELLRDLEGTTIDLRDNPYVDRFTLNISCANTKGKDGKFDNRNEHQKQFGDMLSSVRGAMFPFQDLYVKVSPDLDEGEIEDTLSTIKDYNVSGVITTNTTTDHDLDDWSASGDVVYDLSLEVQKMFNKKIKENSMNLEIIACGGIDSVKRLNERLENGAVEIQVLTPLIFKGPKLLRRLKK